MPRKKVALSWIAHDATRRVTFKKRKKSLLKKTMELATLCGVDACAVVYGSEEEEPEVWPSPAEAARVLERLRAAPEPYQGRKKMDQVGFLRLQAAKLQDQIRRQERENRELEEELLLHEVLSAGERRMCNTRIEEAAELVRLVELKLVLVSNRIEREKAWTLVEPPLPPPLVEQAVRGAVPEVEPKLEEDLPALPWPELTEEDLAEVEPELTEEDFAALPWPELTEEDLAAVPLSCIHPESAWLEELDYHQCQDTFDLFNNFNC